MGVKGPLFWLQAEPLITLGALSLARVVVPHTVLQELPGRGVPAVSLRSTVLAA